jgi:hypothetical protein
MKFSWSKASKSNDILEILYSFPDTDWSLVAQRLLYWIDLFPQFVFNDTKFLDHSTRDAGDQVFGYWRFFSLWLIVVV